MCEALKPGVLFMPAEQLGRDWCHTREIQRIQNFFAFFPSIQPYFLVEQRMESTIFESNEPEYSHKGFILCSL